jgi:hypothetical protein
MTTTSAPDGLGDGSGTEPFTIDLDISGLTREQLSDYRHQLRLAIYYPGTDYDATGGQSVIDEAAYRAKLADVEVRLAEIDAGT